MPIDGPSPLTRKELALILGNNQRAIRAFEKLFNLVPGEFDTQLELIEETVVGAGTAFAQSSQALASLQALADTLDLLPPVPPAPAPLDDLTPAPVPDPPPRYGRFSRTTDDTLALANTAEVIDFDTAGLSFGVVIDGTNASRITVDTAGRYSFDASFQLSSASAAVKSVWVWFRVNGTDVVGSARKVSLESATALATPSLEMLFDLAASDYVELAWAADDTDVVLDAMAATAFAPAVAACILSVKQLK